MIDRIFSAALAFCVLAGATAAIATAWFEAPPAATAAAMPVVHLQPVVVTGQARTEPATTLATTDAVEPALRKQQ